MVLARPEDMYNSISNASISSLEKMYLAFPVAFGDRNSTRSDVVNADSDTYGNVAAPLPGLAHFLNPDEYAPAEHQSWCLELNALSKVENFGEHAQAALLWSLFGDCGRELTCRPNNLSSTSQEYFDLIINFFETY